MQYVSAVSFLAAYGIIIPVADREKPSLKELWRQTPHKPGVYIMKDALGNTIYVGKAKDLHRRLGNYFSPTGATLSNHKTRALINAIASFDYFETRNDQEAFLLESKLIKQYRPHYNIQMKDDKRYPLLKIPKGEKLPRFQLARVRKDDGARYFRPLCPLPGALRHAGMAEPAFPAADLQGQKSGSPRVQALPCGRDTQLLRPVHRAHFRERL